MSDDGPGSLIYRLRTEGLTGSRHDPGAFIPPFATQPDLSPVFIYEGAGAGRLIEYESAPQQPHHRIFVPGAFVTASIPFSPDTRERIHGNKSRGLSLFGTDLLDEMYELVKTTTYPTSSINQIEKTPTMPLLDDFVRHFSAYLAK